MINNYRRKLELKDDMYIRTSYGRIDKILELDDSYVKGVSQKNNSYVYDLDSIVKASYNIIDILEVGDYVNGYEVKDIDYAFDDIALNVKNPRIVPYIDNIKNAYIDNIKSVITHEQMEQMAYKVGE